MVAKSASCPACGTFLTITHDSTVSMVCKRCRAVLEYRGGAFQQVGSAAVVVPTQTSIQVGEEGGYQGTRFQITGHVQLSNQDGATWDEFYLGFSDGLCGWLAQSQGRLLLLFRSPLPDGMLLPPIDSLQVNDTLGLMPGLPPLSAIEKGEARVEAATGQMPYVLRPGETYPYADFSNMQGAFASLDYGSDPPDLFVGREVTFADLGMQPRTAQMTVPVESDAPLLCTECGNRLEIHNPGKTERITCLQCRTLFDVTSGRPVAVSSQEEPTLRPVVPIGTKARFGNLELTLMGFIEKSTVSEGIRYAWHEYLLSDGAGGYRWLVMDSDGHWSLFEPISGGSKTRRAIPYNGKTYKLFQFGDARIDYLEGEFYWNAEVGQHTETADYVAPPHMLSVEYSESDSTRGEASWTHGVYLPVGVVRTALGSSEISTPRRVSPNQPFNHTHVYWIWGMATLAVVMLGIFFGNFIETTKVFEKHYEVQVPQPKEGDPPPAPGEDPVQEIEEKIKLEGGKNIRIYARANLESTWVELSGLLSPEKDEDRPVVQPFNIPIEHYSGIEDGERWTEGDKEDSVYLSALPAGEYTLRINVYKDKKVDKVPNRGGNPLLGGANFGLNQQDPAFVSDFTIVIEQGHPHVAHIIWACVLLAIIPIIVGIVHWSFENRRWQNSNAVAHG